MNFFITLILNSLEKVMLTFVHNWPYLVASIVIAALLKSVLEPEKISAFLQRYSKAGVAGATIVAVATPLCSCGTMAIILGMMANTMPWAPIIAFMVASPLTSPQELVYSAGLFGWPFAIAFFVSSILLGLAGGYVATLMDRRGWLKNQGRFSSPAKVENPEPACGCSSTNSKPKKKTIMEKQNSCGCSVSSPFVAMDVAPSAVAAGCGCAAVAAIPDVEIGNVNDNDRHPRYEPVKTSQNSVTDWRAKTSEILGEMWNVAKQLVPLFFIFAFVGYFINGLIPQAWVSSLFGSGKIYSIPLAATLGLPFYINTEASLPLVRALIDGGMSQGAALAFLITGAGTSIGAFSGALTIARWRVIGTVVGTLWLGSIILGYLYNVLMATGLV